MGRGDDDALNRGRVRRLDRSGRLLLLLLARTDRAAMVVVAAPAKRADAATRSVVVRAVQVRAVTIVSQHRCHHQMVTPRRTSTDDATRLVAAARAAPAIGH
jgi:hypothetical protein